MDLTRIRYKGDLNDTIDLFEDYKVKQIIDSHEEILSHYYKGAEIKKSYT